MAEAYLVSVTSSDLGKFLTLQRAITTLAAIALFYLFVRNDQVFLDPPSKMYVI